MNKSDSPKLRLYRGLLMWSLPLLRNRLYKRWQSQKMRHDTIELAELLHLVPPLLDSKGFGTGDEYFLRVGVSRFLESFSAKDSATYVSVADRLEELYQHVREELEVDWEFPDSVREAVLQHRKAQEEHRRRVAAE